MKTVLSIQSQVVYGYVGNKAAVFPLQRMGINVHVVNTVQFSNHTGYGAWTGDIFSAAHIQALIDGLEERNVLKDVDAVLSGYLGSAALGNIVLDTVAKIKKQRPDAIYCCDPVMGDVGRVFFVKEGLPPFFREHAIPQAGIITPNQFEIAALTGIDIQDLNDAVMACAKIHEQGVQTVLLTSLQTKEIPDNEIGLLLSDISGEKWIVTKPRVHIEPEPNGAGDMTAAIFLGRMLSGRTKREALEKTATTMHKVFTQTKQEGTRELALIAAQDCFADGDILFQAEAL